MPSGPNATELTTLPAGSVSMAVTLPVVMFHRYTLWSPLPTARLPSGPNATDLTPWVAGSVSVAMSLPVVVRVRAGCSWETAAGAAGDRGHALGAEDGCMRGVGCCCWLSSSGAIRAR